MAATGVTALPISLNAGHLTEESLGLHVLGDLPIFREVRVQKHLSNCGHCRNRLEQMREIIAAFRMQPTTGPHPASAQRIPAAKANVLTFRRLAS